MLKFYDHIICIYGIPYRYSVYIYDIALALLFINNVDRYIIIGTTSLFYHSVIFLHAFKSIKTINKRFFEF